MRLDIYSDPICPWCFIGLRRLQCALDETPRPDLIVRWRPFQLNPGMPTEGMDRREYLDVKFGGRARADQVYGAIAAAGRDEAIPFHFDAIKRTPNTLDSHRLLRFAAEKSDQTRLAETLFDAYFLRGADLGDHGALVREAESVGLDGEAARLMLESDWMAADMVAEDRYARQMGISGAPCFIVDGKYAVSGAQAPDVLNKLFDLTAAGELA